MVMSFSQSNMIGCCQVIEGYMSAGAVYVVVIAGSSLAFFACVGIHAVRTGGVVVC